MYGIHNCVLGFKESFRDGREVLLAIDPVRVLLKLWMALQPGPFSSSSPLPSWAAYTALCWGLRSA